MALTYFARKARGNFVGATPNIWLLGAALSKFRCGARKFRCGVKEIYVEEVEV